MSLDTAVATLMADDPEFGLLCEVLYGTQDVDLVLNDLSGVSKSDGQHNLLRRFGLAATVAGAGLGVGELGHALAHTSEETGLHTFRNVGPKAERLMNTKAVGTPLKFLKKPKVAAGLAGTMLAGDLAAGHSLKAPPPQQKPPTYNQNDVTKAEGPGFLRLVRPSTFRPSTTAKPFKSTEEAADFARSASRSEKAGRITGKAIRMPFTTMKEHPIASTAVGVAGTTAYLNHRRNKPVPYQTYDPNYAPDLVGKSFDAEGTFSKFDDDKRLAFGWASIVKKDGLPVVDRQGDYISVDDLEDAAYRYVLSSRVGGDMHKRAGTVGERPHHVSDLVESFVITPEKIEKMGLPKDTPQGWWVGFKVHDPETWAEVRKGGRTGFSIHGKGKRAATNMDELVGA